MSLVKSEDTRYTQKSMVFLFEKGSLKTQQ